MKKTIIALSVMLSGLFAGNAFAQTPVAQTPCPVAQCVQQNCANPDSACARPGRPCPFDGLNLTARQQEQLKAICPDREKRAEKRAAVRDDRKEYLAKVKGILTPEQYVQFLENSYVNRPSHKVGGPQGRRHDKRGHAMRGERRQQRMTATQAQPVQQTKR